MAVKCVKQVGRVMAVLLCNLGAIYGRFSRNCWSVGAALLFDSVVLLLCCLVISRGSSLTQTSPKLYTWAVTGVVK
eukprot:2696765-Prorocentrum_lima.AAC.1